MLASWILVATVGCGDEGGGDTVDGGNGIDSGPALLISGVVLDERTDPSSPLEGATVSVHDASPPISDTTGADGTFSLMVPNGTATVYLAVTAAEFYPMLAGLDVVGPGASFSLSPVPASEVADILTALGRTQDPAKGILVVTFNSPIGGEAAEISAASDTAFVIDPSGDAIEGNALIAKGGDTIVFTNVTAGTTSVTLAAAGRTCTTTTASTAAVPVDPGVMTFVLASCQ